LFAAPLAQAKLPVIAGIEKSSPLTTQGKHADQIVMTKIHIAVIGWSRRFLKY